MGILRITAAAVLGFRMAAATSHKNITRNSMFSRSITSLTKTTASTSAVERENTSNIFLCFDERKQSGNKLDTNIVLRNIRLDSYDNHKEEEMLERSTHRFPVYKDVINPEQDREEKDDHKDDKYQNDKEEKKLSRAMACQTRITRLGSEILFTVGQTLPRDICWVNPLTRPVKFHVSSQTETKIKSFSMSKYDMRWGVIDGKLYCFDNCSPSQTFEVLDLEINETSWHTLREPTFIREDGSTDKYSVLFLNESRKILGWDDERRGVLHCFDATKPDKGWIELGRGFGDTISLIGKNDIRLVIHDNHPELGDFNLMFTYDCRDEPFLISLFFISDNCDSFKYINEPVRLPRHLCSKYRVGYLEAQEKSRKELPRACFNSQFVQLGSKKFCLIMHKFDEKDDDDDGRSKGNILVTTFEYDVIVSDKTNVSDTPLEIKTRILGTRCFRYYLQHETAEQNDMIGAFSF